MLSVLDMAVSNIIVVVVLVLVLYYATRQGPNAVERLSRVATADDQAAAITAFTKNKCLAAGHIWTVSPDGHSWDCSYSKDTCKANSAWPEVTAEESPDGMAKFYLYWHPNDEKCYLGLGSFRKKCEDLGMKWLEDTQQCRTTPQYCKSKLLMYKDGDCYNNPVTSITEKILGKTLGRAISMGGIGGLINAANWGENDVL